ncbi:hypothetical protein [Humibacter sp.]|uniref:hypothetical protein n=1 Tax=Humibacter sp. TaxID=1940291 RepID=UPI003F7CFA13
MRSAAKAPTRPTFRCGHSTSAENVIYRRQHLNESYRAECRQCEQAQNRKYYEREKTKQRQPKPFIVPRGKHYEATMREAKAQFEREMARLAKPYKPTGRPKKAAA